MLEVTLFHMEREDIKIDVVARFEGDILIIDGYDIGKTVKEYWGDSDYEYVLRILPPGVDGLSDHFKVPRGDHDQLLRAIQQNYNGNHCFSQLEDLVSELKLPHDGYKWT